MVLKSIHGPQIIQSHGQVGQVHIRIPLRKLAIYRQLAQRNPDVYLPYLAVTLNNLGAVDRLQNHLDEARKDYEESLKINRQLAQQNPAKYLPNMALILNEYGRVDASQNRMQVAREHYEL